MTADVEQRQVQYATQTTTSWNLTLENTALLETNASIDALGVYLDSSGVEVPWYLGMTASNFSLQGKGTADVSLTIVYPEAPEPGLYRIDVVGLDVDNGISYPLSLPRCSQHTRVPNRIRLLDCTRPSGQPNQSHYARVQRW